MTPDIGGPASAGNAARSAARSARSAAPDGAGDAVDTLGKVGVAAMGVVHLLLGWVALQIVIGGGQESADNTGALKGLADSGVGRVALGLLAVGFAAYAVAQAVAAVAGHRSSDGKKRLFRRVSSGVKAAIGVSLGLTCVRLLLGSGQKDSSDQQADLTARLMEAPAGRFLVGIVGLAVIAFAVYQGRKGLTRSFLEHIAGHPGHRLELLGVIGYVARGAAFGLLGALLVVAAVREQPEKAQGLDGALKTLAGQPYGSFMLVAVALGLAAFGAFQLLTARRYTTD